MKRNIYIMNLVTFLQGLVFYGPVATLYRQSRGLNINQIFMLESIIVVLMLIFEIPWGYFADRFGYKITLNISFFIFFLSKIVFFEAHNFLMFLLEAVMISLSISGITGCDSAIIYSSLDGQDSAMVFSHYIAWGNAGLLAASILSTFMIKISLSSTAFMTIFPYGAAYILSLFLVDTREKDEKQSFKRSFRNVLKNKNIFLFIISISLVSESTHSLCVFLNQPQYVKSGIPVIYFGLLTALMQVLCILSAKSYKFSEKFGERKMIISLFAVAALASFLLAFTSSPVITIILIALIETSFALCQPLSSKIQNEAIETADRATLLSVYAMVSDITAAISNLPVGKAAETSLEHGLILCGTFCLAAAILAFIYFKREVHKQTLSAAN